MITAEEIALLAKHAYVPEHLPSYVTAVSPAEPFLAADFVMYRLGERLNVIGYPLRGEFDEPALSRAIEEAVDRFDPGLVGAIAPVVPEAVRHRGRPTRDAWFRLELTGAPPPDELRDSIDRAAEGITVTECASFGREHRRLIRDLLRTRPVEEEVQILLGGVPRYSRTATARTFEARNADGALVGAEVAEFGAEEYAFHLFEFRSAKRSAPGVEDLLLSRVVDEARAAGKRWLGLGLAVDEEGRAFRERWGGVPFLDHVTSVEQREPPPA